MDAVLEAPLPALQPSLGPEAMPSPQTSAPFLAAAERQAGFPRCGTPGTRSGTAVSAGCAMTCGALLACERWCKLSHGFGIPWKRGFDGALQREMLTGRALAH